MQTTDNMEIERKFLVAEIDTESPLSDLSCYQKHEIHQSYISHNPTIRLRKSDDEYYLTLKSPKKSDSLGVKEFEINITQEQYNELLKKADMGSVQKTRYVIPLQDDGHDDLFVEFDIYHGRLNGLLTLEVEFIDEKSAENFTPPYWFGQDVSRDKRYNNTSLSIYGIPTKSQQMYD